MPVCFFFFYHWPYAQTLHKEDEVSEKENEGKQVL